MTYTETKKPSIIWVDSWKDIPDVDPTQAGERLMRACYDGDINVIHAVKNKATKYDIEHEQYHAQKTNEHVKQEQQKHPSKTRKQILDEQRAIDIKKPKYGLEDDIAEEFEAHKYAFEKTGKPRHLYNQISAMYEWLTERTKPQDKEALYVINKPSQAMKWLHKHLIKVKPPQEWVDDFQKLERQYHKEYKEYKDDSRTIYYKDTEYNSTPTMFANSNNVKNTKPWWEDDFYQTPTPTKAHNHKAKSSGSWAILPPQFDDEI